MATPEPGAGAAPAADSAPPDTPAPAPLPRSPVGALLSRLLVVHLVAWAVAFGSAVAQMPIAIWFRKSALLHAKPTGATLGIVKDAARGLTLTPTEGAQLQIVLTFILWGGGAILLAVHLAGLPWAIGAARAARHPERSWSARRALRIFGFTCATIACVVLLAGVVGWIWLYTL